MTTREKLNLLSKEDLINAIMKSKNPHLIAKLENQLSDQYYRKISDICDAQEACNLKTSEGRKIYSRLESEYNRVKIVFDKICEV